MYHSIRMAVNIGDVLQNERPSQPRTIRCSTYEPNHHGVKLGHRTSPGIRASAPDMRPRSELDPWLGKSRESSNFMSDIARSKYLTNKQENRVLQRSMRWPCNHHWGSRACNKYVDSMGAKCQDCQNCKDMDSTPTHTRLAHMYDVDVFVEGFRNAGLNAACIVEMMKDGASEKALLDALDVIQENDTDWYDRIKYVVPQGISQYKKSEAKRMRCM